MNYRSYISSSAWTKRKTLYYKTHPKKCARCGSGDDIHLHHHTYDRLGAELDADLVAVCEPCHKLIHKYHDAHGGSLTVATFEVIRPKRKRRKPAAKSTFVPANQRGATRDSEGRVVSPLDWRHETRGRYQGQRV